MRISGFSYVRNCIRLGYPFIESVLSVLPVCDEFIMAVGDSTDGTRNALEQLNDPKIKIVDTVWDDRMRENGKIFSQQTNIALDHIKGDWALHIQADEVLHEKDLPKITEALRQYEHDKKVEGFIQPFLHFWGSYDYIRTSRRVHKYEVRIFRNDKLVRSFRDSQGFRKYSSQEAYEQGEKGEKLKVKKLDVPVFHYNAVRPVSVMNEKVFEFRARYDAGVLEAGKKDDFDYQKIDRLEKYGNSHPAVMKERIAIARDNNDFVFDPKKSVWSLKDRIMQPIEDWLGFKIGEYKNYKLLK